MTRLLRIARAYVHTASGVVAYRLGWHGAARRQFERVLLLRGADFRAYVHLGRIAFDLGDYAGWRREFEHARRTDALRFARLQHPMELFEPRLAGTSLDPAAPGRFLGDGLAGDGYEGTDARATWRALRPGSGESRSDRSLGDAPGRGNLPLAPGFDPLISGPQLDDPRRAEPFDERDFDVSPFGSRYGDSLGQREDGLGPDDGIDELGQEDDERDAALHGDDFSSASERRRFQLRRPIDRHEIARCNLDELARRLSS